MRHAQLFPLPFFEAPLRAAFKIGCFGALTGFLAGCNKESPSPSEISFVGKQEVASGAPAATLIGTLLMGPGIPTGGATFTLLSNTDTFTIVKDSLRVGRISPNYAHSTQHVVRIQGKGGGATLTREWVIKVTQGANPAAPLDAYLSRWTRATGGGKYLQIRKENDTYKISEVAGPAIYALNLEGTVTEARVPTASEGAAFKNHNYGNDGGPASIQFHLVCQVRIDKVTVGAQNPTEHTENKGKTLTWYFQLVNSTTFWKYEHPLEPKAISTNKTRVKFQK